MPPTNHLLFIPEKVSCVNLQETFSVEVLVLKPYCSVSSMLFMLVCSDNLLYISFSEILEKDTNSDVGLELEVISLSPFLNTGLTTQNFSLSGKTP
jgi:hypothetical protein